VDETLRLFGPTIALHAIKPMKESAPTRFGNLTRTVMDELRAASGLIPVKQLVTTVFAKRGIAAGDK